MAEGCGGLGSSDLLLGLKLTGGERLIECDRDGEPNSEDEHEHDVVSLPLSSNTPSATAANTLLDPDPFPLELSRSPEDPLGE